MSGGAIILAPKLRRLGLPHDHPAIVYLLGLSTGSRDTQLRSLRWAARFLNEPLAAVRWGQLSAIQMLALRSALASAHAPATCNRILSAVRGVQRAAVRLGEMTADDFARSHVAPVRGRRIRPGRSLAGRELRALFRAAAEGGTRTGGRGAGLRLAAILALLYGCGLRRAELSSLRLDGFMPGASVRMVGKGNDEREVPLPPGAGRALASWASWRGDAPGFLVCGIRRAPERADPSARMHPSNVYLMLQRLAERAHVAPFSPHDLRRTYAGDLLDAGVDLATVQALMGHRDPVTTSSYDRRGARVLAEAVKRLEVPAGEG